MTKKDVKTQLSRLLILSLFFRLSVFFCFSRYYAPRRPKIPTNVHFDKKYISSSLLMHVTGWLFLFSLCIFSFCAVEYETATFLSSKKHETAIRIRVFFFITFSCPHYISNLSTFEVSPLKRKWIADEVDEKKRYTVL